MTELIELIRKYEVSEKESLRVYGELIAKNSSEFRGAKLIGGLYMYEYNIFTERLYVTVPGSNKTIVYSGVTVPEERTVSQILTRYESPDNVNKVVTMLKKNKCEELHFARGLGESPNLYMYDTSKDMFAVYGHYNGFRQFNRVVM